MIKFLTKHRRWLLPAVLILFILEVVTFPLVAGMTWVGRSDVPAHMLTYRDGVLRWAEKDRIDANGVFHMRLFDSGLEFPWSDSHDPIIAPGMSGSTVIRLINQSDNSVGFTAVLYEIRTNEDIPAMAALAGEFDPAQEYPLPTGVAEEQVVRAVTGIVDGNAYQDFDLSWIWDFETEEDQDALDTLLANEQGDPDTVTVGLYIMVHDQNTCLPELPKTGDGTVVGMYLVLMAISATLLVLMLVNKGREKQ